MSFNALIFAIPRFISILLTVETPDRKQRQCNPVSLSELQDEELVNHLKHSNDTRAFDELVRRHQSTILNVLYHFCPYHSELEDLAQEAFIKAYRKIDQWSPSGEFIHWLKRIAYNTGYDYFRKNKRNPIRLADTKKDEENEYQLERIVDNNDNIQESENTELVQKILSHLAADDRMLLTLQYLKELSIAEIADQMGWTESKTKVRSFRAKKKLKKVLERYEIQADK